MTTKELLFDVLYSAIVEIRTYSASANLDPARVNWLANLIHNWPAQMSQAESDTDWQAILEEAWRLCDPRSRSWLRSQLEERGVDVESL